MIDFVMSSLMSPLAASVAGLHAVTDGVRILSGVTLLFAFTLVADIVSKDI